MADLIELDRLLQLSANGRTVHQIAQLRTIVRGSLDIIMSGGSVDVQSTVEKVMKRFYEINKK